VAASRAGSDRGLVRQLRRVLSLLIVRLGRSALGTEERVDRGSAACAHGIDDLPHRPRDGSRLGDFSSEDSGERQGRRLLVYRLSHLLQRFRETCVVPASVPALAGATSSRLAFDGLGLARFAAEEARRRADADGDRVVVRQLLDVCHRGGRSQRCGVRSCRSPAAAQRRRSLGGAVWACAKWKQCKLIVSSRGPVEWGRCPPSGAKRTTVTCS